MYLVVTEKPMSNPLNLPQNPFELLSCKDLSCNIHIFAMKEP